MSDRTELGAAKKVCRLELAEAEDEAANFSNKFVGSVTTILTLFGMVVLLLLLARSADWTLAAMDCQFKNQKVALITEQQFRNSSEQFIIAFLRSKSSSCV